MGQMGDDILILLAIGRILDLNELANAWRVTEKSISITNESSK
tara:strand:+ start:202 stop:330 length:129 start_codon:yes stop_codon:yes gene_type:complete